MSFRDDRGKRPKDMSITELQAEIGRLQSLLHYKVSGDPRHYVSVGTGGTFRGCVCPPGAEINCAGWNCPRRPISFQVTA